MMCFHAGRVFMKVDFSRELMFQDGNCAVKRR